MCLQILDSNMTATNTNYVDDVYNKQNFVLKTVIIIHRRIFRNKKQHQINIPHEIKKKFERCIVYLYGVNILR